ncbi:hypothetical protein RB595_000260 [Gaeumannomyces hyphopodioides]
MANQIIDGYTIDDTSFSYIFEQDVAVQLQAGGGLIRCNVYRPKESGPVPVLVTYGPYGKDIHYQEFNPRSFSEVNPKHRSAHSAWETPDPGFWTAHGYAVVRADERGSGQSPGVLDTMSRGTTDAFCDLIEWAAAQPWSSGKVGLLGVSYYAGSQWRVAARRPRGLAAMVPWEGMSDYYRDRCRHGGILSSHFIRLWWDRQVAPSQYGRPGRAQMNWGPDTLEGDMPMDVLAMNRHDQTFENSVHRFRDEAYYASRDYDLADIEVPLLSVANWGGISLHLRGNVQGFLHASSRFKYLRTITGRHDLPFYYDDEVEVQRSFLDAFLKGDDRAGWSVPGKVPPVDLVLRKGNVGYNDPAAESAYLRRTEAEWPPARTRYERYFLTPDLGLDAQEPQEPQEADAPTQRVSYWAPDPMSTSGTVQFLTAPFAAETEITGHPLAHLNVSASTAADPKGDRGGGDGPSDIDLFLTLRHIGPDGAEVLYTGTAGDPVPLCKGWLRVSLRATDPSHPRHRDWLPHREYRAADVQPVVPGEVYGVDVELWPTCVVVEAGGRIMLEVASGDTNGSGLFLHNDPIDRPDSVLEGWNHINFGPGLVNYLVLPIV